MVIQPLYTDSEFKDLIWIKSLDSPLGPAITPSPISRENLSSSSWTFCDSVGRIRSKRTFVGSPEVH